MVTTSQSNSRSIYEGYVASSGVTLTTPTILSVNYYDDYAFMGYNDIPAATDTHFKYEETGYGVRYTGGYQGLLTGTMTAQLNSDGTVSSSYLYSVMYYDDRGRVIQTKSNNHLTGGTEAEYFAYNFTGQVTRRKHVHAATGKSMQTELYTYAYDTAGRLTTVKHKLNSGAEVTLANNSYDELGRLQTNQRNGSAVLKSTYMYNVRSWIKSITSTLFTQMLYYNDTYGGSTARYNGNISAMSWRVANEVINGTTTTKTRGYKFTYDNLSRLTAADYLENAVAKDYFNTVYTYDKHGNIKTLTRRGNTGTTTYGIIDNLTMSYSGNQLTKVEDTGTSVSLSASMDFKNGSNTATEYTYNKKGSLTKDANKGISSIAYNLLNLPRSLSISNNLGSGTNMYTYAADGTKLSTNISNKTTDYCGNVIYESGVLKRILIEGGYIEGGTYYFYLTDHLGNNRVVANASGTIVQSNHYYPYSMSFTEGTQTSTQPFKFGNKELDIQKGLNWYDFEARWKDDWSFPTMDLMAEKYYSWSPYGYCKSNPMNRIDPDGKDDYLLEPRGRLHNRTPHAQRGRSGVDRLYSYSGNSKSPMGESITVKSGLLSQMSKMQKKEGGYGTYGSTQNIESAAQVFKFASDHSKVEWKLDVYDDDGTLTAVIATDQKEDNVQNGDHAKRELSVNGTKVVNVHSHPNANGTKGGSDRDMENAKRDSARNGVYFKANKTLYEYDNSQSNIKETPIQNATDLLKQLGIY